MSKNYDDIAKAFLDGKTAHVGTVRTDGYTYWLHDSPIAVKGDGVVAFDFCGWRTPTTAGHMNRIIRLGDLGGFASYAAKGSPDKFTLTASWSKAAPVVPEGGHKPPSARYCRYDAWRGHSVPALAVLGASDTGMWDDSPAPSAGVTEELTRFQLALKYAVGVRSTLKHSETSNVFATKRWVMVSQKSFELAAQFAVNWLKEHNRDTRYVHDANLEELGYEVTDKQAGLHTAT